MELAWQTTRNGVVQPGGQAAFVDAADAFGCDGGGPTVDFTGLAAGDYGSVWLNLRLVGGKGAALLRGRPCRDDGPPAIDATVIPIQTEYGVARPMPGQFPLTEELVPSDLLPMVEATVVQIGDDEGTPVETVLGEGTMESVLTDIAQGNLWVGADPSIAGSCLVPGAAETVRVDWAVPDDASLPDCEDATLAVALGAEAIACEPPA